MNRLRKNQTSAGRDRAGAAAAVRGDRAVHDALTSSHFEGLLDEGLAETFPASDPVAVTWPGGVTPRNI